MNSIPFIKQWIYKHKTSLSLSLLSLSIPLLCYTYTKRRRQRLRYLNLHSSRTPLPPLGQPKSFSTFLQSLITHPKVISSIEHCVSESFTSKELYEKAKSIGQRIIDHIRANPIIINDLKVKLIEIASCKELTKEGEKFIQFIKRDIRLSNEVLAFIESILYDPSVIDYINQMAKDSSYKALESQRVIDSFDSFTNEMLSNEQLIKFIYKKAIDIFSNTSQKTNKESNGNGNITLKYTI